MSNENIEWPESLEPTRVEGRQYPYGGYAPGNYMNKCNHCKKMFIGDKRAWRCEPCAEKFMEKESSAPIPRPGETPQNVLRWVKGADRLPDGKVTEQIIIRGIRVHFDFFMFLKYILNRDIGKKEWHLWDGYHEWYLKITPELLSQIEWLEEIEAPAIDIETFLHMDMPEYLKDGRAEGRFSWEKGYKAAAMRFSNQQPKETSSSQSKEAVPAGEVLEELTKEGKEFVAPLLDKYNASSK